MGGTPEWHSQSGPPLWRDMCRCLPGNSPVSVRATSGLRSGSSLDRPGVRFGNGPDGDAACLCRQVPSKICGTGHGRRVAFTLSSPLVHLKQNQISEYNAARGRREGGGLWCKARDEAESPLGSLPWADHLSATIVSPHAQVRSRTRRENHAGGTFVPLGVDLNIRLGFSVGGGSRENGSRLPTSLPWGRGNLVVLRSWDPIWEIGNSETVSRLLSEIPQLRGESLVSLLLGTLEGRGAADGPIKRPSNSKSLGESRGYGSNLSLTLESALSDTKRHSWLLLPPGVINDHRRSGAGGRGFTPPPKALGGFPKWSVETVHMALNLA
ncbi:hypothetical protein R1flu_016763 [Riccia fluitans]|uniref:Uncharacterized protein n=1 Tax=Riccia fluitans TaxID=41844 RepID=A0ABD1YRN2_9MARC